MNIIMDEFNSYQDNFNLTRLMELSSYSVRRSALTASIIDNSEKRFTGLMEDASVDVNLADTVTPYSSPLACAVRHERTDFLQALLSHPDINVNYQDSCGNTALMEAANNPGHESLKHARYLIEHGANINLKDEAGLTALDYARMPGRNSLMFDVIKTHIEAMEKSFSVEREENISQAFRP